MTNSLILSELNLRILLLHVCLELGFSVLEFLSGEFGNRMYSLLNLIVFKSELLNAQFVFLEIAEYY